MTSESKLLKFILCSLPIVCVILCWEMFYVEKFCVGSCWKSLLIPDPKVCLYKKPKFLQVFHFLFLLVEFAFVSNSSWYLVFIRVYCYSDQAWEFFFLSLASTKYVERKEEWGSVPTCKLHTQAPDSKGGFICFICCHIPKGQKSLFLSW